MLKFLVTTILALLIFSSSFVIVAKIFRNSDQATAEFKDFEQSLEDFATSSNTLASDLLILDQQTAIIVFANRNRVRIYDQEIDTYQHQKYQTNRYYLPFPEENTYCAKGSCACLCKTFEEALAQPFEQEVDTLAGGEVTLVHADIACPNLICRDISDIDFAASFAKYRYTDGEEPENYDNYRRILLNFQKTERGILIQEQ